MGRWVSLIPFVLLLEVYLELIESGENCLTRNAAVCTVHDSSFMFSLFQLSNTLITILSFYF